MNGLILTQYFWPENFKINELVLKLKEHHKIEILTSYPNYPKGKIFSEFKGNKNKYDNYNGIKVIRVPQIPRSSGNKIMIFINYISFIISSFFVIFFLKKKYDFIFVFAPSPIFIALIGIILGKLNKCKVYVWVLDLWPEILEELKLVKSKIILNLINILVMLIYKKVDKIFVQSNSFKEIISKKLKKVKIKKKIITLHSWNDDLGPLRKYNNRSKIFTFLFTGNIGQSQNLSLIVKTIASMKKLKIKKNFQFVIVGSGRNLFLIKQMIKDLKINDYIKLFNFRKPRELNKLINSSDVLYLSLKPGKFLNSTIPAKFQTYLFYKKPILASIDGEVKNLIIKNKCGLVSNPLDEKKLAENIKKFLFMNKKKLTKFGRNSKKLSYYNFNKKMIIKKILFEIAN